MPENKIKITPAKGRPMLNWVGKRPLDYVKGFPAQLIEVFDPLKTGRKFETPAYDELDDNWQNLLFHGDNKEVLATLLELGFRGKIDLIYIDPPFKSGADYVRKVELRGLKNLGRIDEDSASVLQQTMYFDIWNNDNYLQFMYERLMLLKELLSETGSIYVHLDYHIGHYVKLIMDEIFGLDSFKNDISWCYKWYEHNERYWNRKHDSILFYTKSENFTFNWREVAEALDESAKEFYKYVDENGRRYCIYGKNIQGSPLRQKGRLTPEDEKKYPGLTYRRYLDEAEAEGVKPRDWFIINTVITTSNEKLGFQTQKPEALLEKIIKASSNPGDIVLDCFIGSGTTAAVAQKLGRRWIGCDINKGAVQLTSSRLQKIIKEQIRNTHSIISSSSNESVFSFAVYKINNYDLKLLQTEAIELAVQHFGIQRTRTDNFFDGTLGKKLVKIIDFNHPLTLLDLQLIQDELKNRPDEDRDITIVCLGKELAVDPWIEDWNKKHPVNKISIIELKTDKKYGNFLIHTPAEAKIKVKRVGNKAVIKIIDFISPTIIQRLNIDNKIFKVKIPDFRSLIDCVLIDTNYDGNTFHIVYSDIPEKKNGLIKGNYELDIPNNKTQIAIKIIDMLGEEVINVFEV